MSNAVDLIAVRNAAVIFAPRSFSFIAKEIGASNVMVMPDIGATKAREVSFPPNWSKRHQGTQARNVSAALLLATLAALEMEGIRLEDL
jgi:hypothetical protein